MIRRLLSSLFALWFVVVLGDPGLLHACPEHGSHGGLGAASSHTSHQVSGAKHGAPDKPGGGCTCIGSCCAAPVLAPLPNVATFAVPAKIVAPLAHLDFSGDAPQTSPDRLLPFGNGPPRV